MMENSFPAFRRLLGKQGQKVAFRAFYGFPAERSESLRLKGFNVFFIAFLSFPSKKWSESVEHIVKHPWIGLSSFPSFPSPKGEESIAGKLRLSLGGITAFGEAFFLQGL